MKCPTCGRSFDGVRGLTSHHGQTHPDCWQDLFWMYADPGEGDECWEWDGARIGLGYGRLKIHGDVYLAHRLSYRIANGPIENQINHRCDNPPCVNPSHLYDGTRQENRSDASEAGSWDHLTGSNSNNSKLTERQVVEIRRRCAGGESHTSVASDYPVCRSAVSMVARGETYSDAAGPTST